MRKNMIQAAVNIPSQKDFSVQDLLPSEREIIGKSYFIVPFGEWEKNPRLQAKTLVYYGSMQNHRKTSHSFAASSSNVTDEVIMQYIGSQDIEGRRDDDFQISP